MSKFEKVERDGKIAVLYSPGSGAGWFTWNSHNPGLLFDREIVEPVLAGDRAAAIAVAEEKYPGIYTGGGSDLKVEWVPKGERFMVEECDGNEGVQILGPDFGLVA